ncbi:MAG: type II toxin-antitoxin system HicB family antitoxin [Chloroflexota bacterium]
MLTEYIGTAMRHAEYERLDDGTWYGHIPPLQGVWADATTRAACEEELRSVLEEWVALGFHLQHTLPVVDGIDINIHQAVA